MIQSKHVDSLNKKEMKGQKKRRKKKKSTSLSDK